MSEDGAHSLTIIAFIGSVFSPYYAMARRRTPSGAADPQNHCAINIALYGRNGNKWAMTERGRRQLQRDASTLRIGPSQLHWSGDRLQIDLDEWSVPLPSRIRGRVTLHAPLRYQHQVELAPLHRWRPIAPAARVDVDIEGQRWSGSGYLDSNQGDAPLEQAFSRWDWSRAHLSGGRSAVFYDVEPLHAVRRQFGLCFEPDGVVREVTGPPRVSLPGTGWRIQRGARADTGAEIRRLQTLTDAPFYARSLLETQWMGEPVAAFHESLSLTRFDSPWVQAMLAFRMPRRGG